MQFKTATKTIFVFFSFFRYFPAGGIAGDPIKTLLKSPPATDLSSTPSAPYYISLVTLETSQLEIG